MIGIHFFQLVLTKIKTITYCRRIYIKNVCSFHPLEKYIQLKIFVTHGRSKIVEEVWIWVADNGSVGIGDTCHSIQIFEFNGAVSVQAIFQVAVENTNRLAHPHEVNRHCKRLWYGCTKNIAATAQL